MWFKWVGIGFDIKLVHLNHIIFRQYYHASEVGFLNISKSSKSSVWEQRIWVLENHCQNLNTKALENMVIAKLNILHIGTNSQQLVDTHVMQIADSGKCVWFKCEFKSHVRVKIFKRPILRISMIWKWCYYDYCP